ncbi:hypothetical protein N836_00170 [Leptolyngbya sp. Heron Island J]|nr:hypothetical protein N836_00170 [Leptolyngbya sp. Heron Island J]
MAFFNLRKNGQTTPCARAFPLRGGETVELKKQAGQMALFLS